MIKPLWQHQQNFLERNPDKAILAWDGGTGKTRTAIEWLNKRPQLKDVLIVCTKAIKSKWEDDLVLWGCVVPCTVVTKEEVKKGTYKPDALIVDEAHHVSSPLFIAKDRSDITTAIYDIISNNPDIPRLMLTANPVRSSPANLHTLLYMTVRQIPWKEYRDYFYKLTTAPYLPRPVWLPKKGWQKDMVTLIAKYCDVALMSDCFDVPIHEYTDVSITLDKDTLQKIRAVDDNEWDAVKIWHTKNRLENGIEKLRWIKDYANSRRKIVIICKYKEQIAMYAKELSKIREVFTLTGDTKNQGGVIKDAQDSPECFLIIQSQVTAGYDLDQFSTMIFASYDWSWVNYSQAQKRMTRGHNLHRNEYINLVAGDKDKSVLQSLLLKQDFDISKIKNG